MKSELPESSGHSKKVLDKKRSSRLGRFYRRIVGEEPVSPPSDKPLEDLTSDEVIPRIERDLAKLIVGFGEKPGVYKLQRNRMFNGNMTVIHTPPTDENASSLIFIRDNHDMVSSSYKATILEKDLAVTAQKFIEESFVVDWQFTQGLSTQEAGVPILEFLETPGLRPQEMPVTELQADDYWKLAEELRQGALKARPARKRSTRLTVFMSAVIKP